MREICTSGLTRGEDYPSPTLLEEAKLHFVSLRAKFIQPLKRMAFFGFFVNVRLVPIGGICRHCKKDRYKREQCD